MTASPWQYFQIEELKCKCGCDKWLMDSAFMAKVVSLRRELGFPFVVTSAYRCPAHNQKVSTTGPNGPHTTGHAIDINVHHAQAIAFLRAALDHGFTGIGLNQKGPVTGRFIHLDDLGPPHPRPNCWTY